MEDESEVPLGIEGIMGDCEWGVADASGSNYSGSNNCVSGGDRCNPFEWYDRNDRTHHHTLVIHRNILKDNQKSADRQICRQIDRSIHRSL